VGPTAFITLRRLTVRFYRRASPAGSTQETPSSSVIRRAQLAAVMAFAVLWHPHRAAQNQAAVLEPTDSMDSIPCRTDTVFPDRHLEKPKNQIMRQFLTISQFSAGGFMMGLE
jgi:hypothetical protein